MTGVSSQPEFATHTTNIPSGEFERGASRLSTIILRSTAMNAEAREVGIHPTDLPLYRSTLARSTSFGDRNYKAEDDPSFS